jgi:hypothetical protein
VVINQVVYSEVSLGFSTIEALDAALTAVLGLRPLTRDAARYRTYFPTLRLIAP